MIRLKHFSFLQSLILTALICLASTISKAEDAPQELSWDTLAKITFEKCEVENDGFKFMYNCAIFPEEVKALEGQRVKMSGYVYPHEIKNEGMKFFWGPHAMTCPYCSGITPGLLTSANFKDPIEHDFERITITARLVLSPKDLWGLYHRFEEAELVSR